MITVTPIKASSTFDYDPFGMLLVGRTFDVNYRYGFNGKEFDADPYGQGNVYDYGFRIYNPRIGKFLSVDPLSALAPMSSPYNFAGNSPVAKVDIEGLWDIEVHAYENRGKYGYAILIVKDNDGIEVYRTKVRVQGMKDAANDNNPRNRKATYGDTPTGAYKIKGWSDRLSKQNRKTYGPNDVLETDHISGEAAGKRNGMHLHGGRQEELVNGKWQKKKDPTLWNTGGCMRIKDDELKEIQNLTRNLEEKDETEMPGTLVVTNDLVEVNGEYVLPTNYHGSIAEPQFTAPEYELKPLEQDNNIKSIPIDLPSEGWETWDEALEYFQ